MADLALISTHRLHEAGRLRDAFRAEGFTVDLVPGPGHLPDPVSVGGADPGSGVLVLTGGEDGEERAPWINGARSLRFPVLGVWPGGHEVEPGGEGLVEVFRLGRDPAEVALVARRTVERRRLQEATGIVGESESIRELLERVVQIAPVDSTVLVTGESGTGKELVARGIHHLSPRRHRAFLAVNVAALSETLLESELFGHEKGAFTGAIDTRKGFFELANRGTLFLDEIGEMPMATQTKLLRVLEQREFLRVGGEQPIRVDVRIVAATNRDLRDLVVEGAFRRDLFYRLNILDLHLPPLRERRSDIPLLVEHFAEEISRRIDRPFPGLDPRALDILVRHPWPGNVRELRNLVESMVVMAPRRPIEPRDLPLEVREPGRSLRMLPRRSGASGGGSALAPVGSARGHALAPVPGEEGSSPGTGADEEDSPGDREAQPGGEGGGRAGTFRPELEFVFRTLMEMRVDMEDLRREFEAYREEVEDRLESAPHPGLRALPGGVELGRIHGGGGPEAPSRGGSDDGLVDADTHVAGGAEDDPAASRSETLPFEPGMTMEDLEEQAIRRVLDREEGNRRRAAESLGIGERTLYRKIRKYGIDDE
ncbi:MAG: AAA family ATPase [Gemmatimonadales bacterium]|nr:MAG: AAA family ATPase [Gemmatimonadales bacterium]